MRFLGWRCSFFGPASVFFGCHCFHSRPACVLFIDHVSVSNRCFFSGRRCPFFGPTCFSSGGAVFVYAQRAFSQLKVFLLRVSVRVLGWCCSLFGPACISLGWRRFLSRPACVFSVVHDFAECPYAFSRVVLRLLRVGVNSLGGGAVFVYAQLAFFRLVMVMFRVGVRFLGWCSFFFGPACVCLGWHCFRLRSACVFSVGFFSVLGRRAFFLGGAVRENSGVLEPKAGPPKETRAGPGETQDRPGKRTLVRSRDKATRENARCPEAETGSTEKNVCIQPCFVS